VDDDEDEDSLDAYVKEVVDALPPLTDEQRDLLAELQLQATGLACQQPGRGQQPAA
jgi:hypothetical protein